MSVNRATPPGFVQLDLNLFQIDTAVDFDIYIRPEQSDVPVLYRGRNLPFGEDHRQRLAMGGTFEAFIREEDAADLDKYVERNLNRIISNPSVRTAQKAKVLYDTSLRLTAEILHRPETAESLARSGELVRNTVSYILLGRDAFHVLVAMKAYDYRTFAHSVNVCAIGLALAQRVGFESRSELSDFGLGAIFHDVGKTRIAQKVLTKPAPLNDDEWLRMRQHPRIGYEIISKHIDFPEAARAIVLQHHERLDGAGYPEARLGPDIHPFAKIAAIADTFDALTSKRPYGESLDTYAALEEMKQEVGAHFSEDYYREFVKLLGR
jgi:putative nucleotidyltransferase with HDIG domain